MKVILFSILCVAVCATALSASFELKINTQGFGSGRIVGSLPNGTKAFICEVSPSTVCSTQTLPAGSITLTATAAANHEFDGWSHGTGSAACSGNGPCTINLNANSTILATFFPPSVLALQVSGPGKAIFTMNNGAVITCQSGFGLAEPFIPNSQVSIKAVPDAGSNFAGWKVLSGSPAGAMCSTQSNPCVFVIDKRISIEAKFITPPPPPPPPPPPTVTLTVTKGGTGTGTVTDSQGMNCGADCSSSVSAGTAITLRALPSSNSTFRNWSGGTGSATACNNSTAALCRITLSENSTIRATFELTQ
ncbi:hypothetical protein L0222_08445 [bacterium]|nr:hypothetical protein [bacterium]MCI0602753.1 hypothetical protein [bacterium]